MSRSRKDETRLLDEGERDLVARTRRPALSDLGGSELSDLIGRLRERRDRARGIARRQRREMRGKAAPSGARPAGDDAGSREKGALLAEALKRAGKERQRREAGASTSALTRHARRALAMKRAAGDPAADRPDTRRSDEGMRPIPNEGIAPSGALDAEGHKPALERSAKVR